MIAHDRAHGFDMVEEGLGVGPSSPPGWIPIGESLLLILVGLTGVGKTTTQRAICSLLEDLKLLPNRRRLTDSLIITHLQIQEGSQPEPVSDRRQRFDYTRRYREQFPGGMAHALAQLWVDPVAFHGHLLFDGLRGEQELGYACAHLPGAFFAVLEAPDSVRVNRLLGRGDSFDTIALQSGTSEKNSGNRFENLGAPDAASLFTASESAKLFALVDSGAVSESELQAKLQIVAEERRNYDPAAAARALQDLAPDRSLFIDTTRHDADEAAAAIVRAIGWHRSYGTTG